MLFEHAQRVCGTDTTVDIHGIRPGTYPEGMSPIEALRYPWCRQLIDLQVIENASRAEQEGYDAVAISCFYDPGLEVARRSVDIPVTGICESTLLTSKSVGHSFALVGLEESNTAFLRGLVEHYGLQDSVACVTALDPPVTELELDRAFEGDPGFVRRFEESCGEIDTSGADLLVAAEVVLNEALVHNGAREARGLPVVDAYAVMLAYTEMLVNLRRTTGLEATRGVYGRRPPESVRAHFMEVTREVIGEAAERENAAL